MNVEAHPLVRRYLRRLRRATRGLPGDRQAELVEQISEHLRAELPDTPTDGQVREVLRRLGRPEDIVAAEGIPPRRGIGTQQLAAVIGLLVGGLVLPIVGWFIGLVLLWTSTAWTVRDKLIGTLLLPGGLGLPVILGGIATSTTTVTAACQQAVPVTPVPSPLPGASALPGTAQPPAPAVHGSHPLSHCTSTAAGTAVGGWLLLAVLVLVPIATAVYLIKRAEPRPFPDDSAGQPRS